MRKTFIVAYAASLLGLAALVCVPAPSAASPGAPQSASPASSSKTQASTAHSLAPLKTASASSPAQSQIQAGSPPPTQAEIISRAQVLISNQHRDDLALFDFERIERQVTRSGDDPSSSADEKTFRVVPTGLGIYKILLKNGDRPVTSEEYRRQLESWVSALELTLHPEDPRAQSILEKFERKKRSRADLVDAARTAFLPKWLALETLNGRLCDVLELDPNPAFHPRNLPEEAMTHVQAKVWVDHASNQMARGEARVIRDIPVGGGILGKVYRGSSFALDQAEVAPGVWLPTRYEYDYSGRKFLFAFAQHQVIEASRYRRLGPPQQILTMVQAELSSGKLDPSHP